jgi:DASS family divalent anion:Na+ symporter
MQNKLLMFLNLPFFFFSSSSSSQSKNNKSINENQTVWLGGLVLMADQLTELGIAQWIGEGVATALAGVSPIAAALVLAIVYFYSMYIFCSLTGHIVAFVGPFMEAGKVLGVPPFLLLSLLSYFSTLCGCLTNYSSGPIVLYFGQRYCSAKKWFAVGLLVSFMHIAVWFSVGMVWWKILGWY